MSGRRKESPFKGRPNLQKLDLAPYKLLSMAVVRMAADDIAAGGELAEVTKKCVMRGGLELWLSVLEIEMTPEKFISYTERYSKENK